MREICKRSGELFIVSGPSGAGKGTICRELLEAKEGEGITLSVSATTREPREGEVEGVNYFFIDKETFLRRVDEGGFLEYAEVYGNYYGTPKQNVVDKLAQGIDVLLEIDIQGAMNVKKSYPDGIFIFILPPSLQELRNRLIKRGTDSMETIELRLSKTMEEVRQIHGYDYFIINDDLGEAVEKMKDIVSAEHSRVNDYGEELVKYFEEEENA